MSDIDLIRANLRRNPYGALMPSEIVAMCDEIDALRAKVADAWDEGYEAGHEDARAVQATYPQSTPNPYRGQRAILAEMANDAQQDGATAP